MKTSIKEKVNGKITLEVELESSVFQGAVNKAAKKLASKVNIPGFRKGKVPKTVLQKFVGSEAISAEAVDDILPDTYIKALEQEKIEPIDQPNIDLVQFEEGKPLIFTAEIPVKPDVELGNYKGVEVKHKDAEVTEKEIENYLGTMQQRHAQIEAVPDKALEEGDTAIMDFEGFLDGEAFEGGKGENYSLVIGSKTFIPGFEEQLVGMKPGEEKDITITFPEDYGNETLKGKETTFKVKMNEVKVKKLMSIDDEFAKDISEFETLEELKQDVENKLKKAAEQENEQQIRNKVLDKVAEGCQVEVPNVLIERKIDDLIKEMEFRIQQQGLTLENYLKFTNSSMEQMREQYEENASNSVKIDLILEAIAKTENIEVTDEELDKEIEKVAEQNKQPAEQIKLFLQSQGRLDSFKDSLMIDKAVNLLVESAKIVEPKAEETVSENKEENL
ncbi:MAG: trigger factor [Desulfitibacter sp. BRH_c19]|nr:MAG: trigger factor [Desulfitibacter sp. BRH_c19]